VSRLQSVGGAASYIGNRLAAASRESGDSRSVDDRSIASRSRSVNCARRFVDSRRRRRRSDISNLQRVGAKFTSARVAANWRTYRPSEKRTDSSFRPRRSPAARDERCRTRVRTTHRSDGGERRLVEPRTTSPREYCVHGLQSMFSRFAELLSFIRRSSLNPSSV